MGTNYRAKISKKNKYWISKHRFYEIEHHCLQYKEWKDEYSTLSTQGVSGVDYDGMPHGTNVGNPTEGAGLRLAILKNKIDTVDETVGEIDDEITKAGKPSFKKHLLVAVTNEGISYNYLDMVMGIPVGEKTYYAARRKFYWLMSQKI